MRKLLLVIIVIGLSGCFRLTYQLNAPAGSTYRAEYWKNYFVFGLVPEREYHSYSAFCRDDRLIQVRSYMKPANVLSSVLGLHLTSASTLEAVCLKQ